MVKFRKSKKQKANHPWKHDPIVARDPAANLPAKSLKPRATKVINPTDFI